MAVYLRSVVGNSLQHCQARTVKGNRFLLLDIARNPNGASNWRSFNCRPHLAQNRSLVGNSGALDIFSLKGRKRAHECAHFSYLRASEDICAIVPDFCAQIAGWQGAANRLNFTYQNKKCGESTVLQQTADPCKPGQYLQAWMELLMEPSGLLNQWLQSVKRKG